MLLLAACGGPSTTDPTDGTGTVPAPEVVERFADDAAPFEVDDVLVSDPASELPDPEFDVQTWQLTWAVPDSRVVWVADVEPATGLIVPPDGRGTPVGEDMIPTPVIGNGPEWISAADGPHVLFTRNDGYDVFMTHAYETASGWVWEDLPGAADGVTGTGTLVPGDPSPVFAFWHVPSDELRWRTLAGDREGTFGPFDRLAAPRFWGDLAVWNLEVDGLLQAFLFHLDDQALAPEPLTTGDAHAEPTLWAPAELGGELALLVTVGDAEGARAIETWQRFGEAWAPVQRVHPPSHLPFVQSPELLETGGRSYVVFVAGVQADGGDAEIWLASALPDGDVLRRVSDDEPLYRADPEALPVGTGAWVYYSGHRTGGGLTLRRCATGL